MIGFIDFSVRTDCLNLMDSYGEICVRCNCCGRFNEKAKYKCQIETFKRHLKEAESFDNWIEGFEEVQRKNLESTIKSYKEMIEQAVIEDKKLTFQDKE